MSRVFSHPRLGIQFNYPKKYKITLEGDPKSPVKTGIVFIEKQNPLATVPFTMEHFTNEKNATLGIIVNNYIATLKKFASKIPLPIPPTYNVNYINESNIGELPAIIFETELLPIGTKCWCCAVADPASQYYIIAAYAYGKNVPTTELSMFQKICSSIVFLPPCTYGSLHVYRPQDGLVIPIGMLYVITTNPNDENLIFDAKCENEEIFCYSFTNYKNLDEFVSARKSRWSKIEQIKEENIHLNFDAKILSFSDKTSEFDFIEMCFMHNGIAYLINASKNQLSDENFFFWLTGTLFEKPNHSLTNSVLKYTNSYQIPYVVQFPLLGTVFESTTSYQIGYNDGASMTKISVAEETQFTNHLEALDFYMGFINKTGGKIINSDINIRYDKYRGYSIRMSIICTQNNITTMVTGSFYDDKFILMDSMTDNFRFVSQKHKFDQIHDSLEIGNMGNIDHNFKSNLFDCKDFGDVIISGMSNNIETFCFHIGVKFIHSPSWDIKVDIYSTPPDVKYQIFKKNHVGTLTVTTMPFKKTLTEFTDDSIYGFTVLKREVKKIHKFQCEAVDLVGEFGNEWHLFVVQDYWAYTFSYTDDKLLDEFQELVFNTRFIDPMNNGRSIYQNHEYGISFLYPSFEFKPSVINSRDTILHATVDNLEGYEVKFLKHEDVSNINDLIIKRKNYYSQKFRDFENRKPKRHDILDGHCFIASEQGEAREFETFEYAFMKDGIGFTLGFRSWKEQFNLDPPELYLLELKFGNFKRDAICYECFLYNFKMLLPLKAKIQEYLHADSQIHHSEIASFQLEDLSLTFITKEPYNFTGFENFYEEAKYRILQHGGVISSIKLQKLKGQPVSVQVVYHSLSHHALSQKKIAGVMTNFKFNSGSTITIDTNNEEQFFKDEDVKNWIEIHESYQLLMETPIFDTYLQEYSLKIELPSDYTDTLFIFQ